MYDDNGEGPSPDQIVNHLRDNFKAECTIGLENAPTTNRLHAHVFATVPGKGFSTRRNTAFDIGKYHPNIVAITRTPSAAWEYVVKGGNVPVQNVPKPESMKRKTNREEEVFREGLAAPTYNDMLRTIEEGAPQKYTTAFLNISACARHRFPERVEPGYNHPEYAVFDTTPWPELDQWLTEYLPDIKSNSEHSESLGSWTESVSGGSVTDTGSVFSGDSGGMGLEVEDNRQLTAVDPERYDEDLPQERQVLNAMQRRPKSLILYGPSRTGKTCWARSLGRHVHHSNTINMDLHDDTAEYAIFDDIEGGIKEINYKNWLGGQLHFSMTDKYKKKKSIIWGKPSIFISNDHPFHTKRDIDVAWLEANTIVVHIDRPMYC
jgi:hypothetical protein